MDEYHEVIRGHKVEYLLTTLRAVVGPNHKIPIDRYWRVYVDGKMHGGAFEGRFSSLSEARSFAHQRFVDA